MGMRSLRRRPPDYSRSSKRASAHLTTSKKKFESAGATRFGSGWAWLVVVNGGKKLDVISTPNEDNPLMKGNEGMEGIPILGCDVWEHAYYLQYKNRRPAYIANFFKIVNWDNCQSRFDAAK